MGNTTRYFARHSGSWQNPITRYARHNGSWQAVLAHYARHNGVWQMIYSTPAVSVGNSGAVTGAGASSSGTVSGSVMATPGGTSSGSLSYAYAYVSGDSGFSIISGNGTATPTFSHAFSGVANGTTSSGVSATWACTLTDNVTGASATAAFTVGPFAWQNTIPPYTAPVPSASNVSDTIFGFGSASGTASGSTSVSIGGTTSGSYSFAWVRTSAGAGISIDSTTTREPTWSCAVSQGGVGVDAHDETWQLTVTDTVSGLSGSTSIDVYLAAEVDND